MAETTHMWDDFALVMTRGDLRELALTVTKHQGGIASAQDLTGATVWVTGKQELSDLDIAAVFQLNSGELGGVEILDAVAGTVQATLEPEHTTGLPDMKTVLKVDCCWVDADGKPRTFQKGTITVYPDATRG